MKTYFDYVSKSMKVIIVSGKSEDDAIVLMSNKEYNSFKETAQLLSTKNNRTRLQESINQATQGRTVAYQLD